MVGSLKRKAGLLPLCLLTFRFRPTLYSVADLKRSARDIKVETCKLN